MKAINFKRVLKDDNAIIGGVIYMFVMVLISVVLAYALMPALDMFLAIAQTDLQPVAGTAPGWAAAAENIEGLIDFFYYIFVIMAFSAILYAVTTPIRKMLYDKWKQEMGGNEWQ